MNELLQLKNNLDENGIFLSFNGPISQDLMVELGDILKKQMEMADADTSTIVKVFSALVEQSQNIIRHSAERLPVNNDDKDKLMFGTIAVGYTENKYFVLGGNKIKKADESMLKKHLKRIQNLSKEELKKLYHKQRKEGRLEEGNAAGLGLIDLARKASEPIQYEFIHIDKKQTFFSIRSFI
ncbi:MAG: SiaB family protein kinase [Proteobacteria bacterium]|nr:SiaB family protein kinase [Pseudomonadota bacterium]